MPLPDVAFLLVAGVVAGGIGTAGGITSLVSYPALLAVGLPAYEANVANLVAGVACWPASALVSRPELRAVRAYLPAGWPPPRQGPPPAAACCWSPDRICSASLCRS